MNNRNDDGVHRNIVALLSKVELETFYDYRVD